jgi:hypothetical protein
MRIACWPTNKAMIANMYTKFFINVKIDYLFCCSTNSLPIGIKNGLKH